MAVYMVSYDLRAPGRNYQPLYDDLKSVDSVRALESVWLIDVAQTASQVRDALLKHLDANDGVLVLNIPVGSGWAYSDLLPRAGTWLKSKRP